MIVYCITWTISLKTKMIPKGRNIKSQHMNLLRMARLIFVCWQPNESQQTKMSRLYFCYDMILSLFKEAGRLPALNAIILPHWRLVLNPPKYLEHFQYHKKGELILRKFLLFLIRLHLIGDALRWQDVMRKYEYPPHALHAMSFVKHLTILPQRLCLPWLMPRAIIYL